MKLSPDQLEAAVKGCISGDRRAQEVIFRAFFGKMMAVCMRYTHDKDTAQDMLQDAFIKAFDKIKDFNFSGSFEGWLRRIVVNTAIDHFRKNKNIVTLEEDANLPDEGNDQDAANDDFSAFENIKPEMVIEAMHKLTPAYQTVFNLYVFENYSHKDIADALNISVGTSKSNLAKAKMKLKGMLMKHVTYK